MKIIQRERCLKSFIKILVLILLHMYYNLDNKTKACIPLESAFASAYFRVEANANFRFGVGGLASGNANYHNLDTNMLVSPTQNSGVGGIAQRQPPTPGILRCSGI